MGVFKSLVRIIQKKQVSISKEESDYLYLKNQGVETQPGYVTLIGKPVIYIAPGARIVLGKNITLVSDVTWNEAGINHPVILSSCTPGAEIIIHDGVGMSGTSIVASKRIEIGENTALGVNTNIWDTDFHCSNYDDRLKQQTIGDAPSEPIFIDKHCWLGANVTVLKGVTIGENTTIGAMSLVNKSVPANSVAAGIPARVIRENR